MRGNLIIIIFACLPFTALAQHPQTLDEFNKLGKDAYLKNDNMKAAYYFEKAIEIDSLDIHARKGYIATHVDFKAYNIISSLLTSSLADSTYRTLRAICASKLDLYDKEVDDFKWLIVNKIDVMDNLYNLALAEDKWARDLSKGRYKKDAVKDKITIDLFTDALKNLDSYMAYDPKDDRNVIAEISNIKSILNDQYK
jgi:tetratricopeptide (TPR) repeat protein